MTSKPRGFELSLERRQMVVVMLLAGALLALISATAYFAGNSMTLEPVPALVVQPKLILTPPPLPAPPTEAPAPASRGSRLIAGQTYLQLAAVDRGIAEVFVEFLSREGFPAVVGPGPDETLYRVLVGPLKESQISVTQAQLKAAGYGSFVRKYQAPRAADREAAGSGAGQ
ncbi:MAG: SPOR domain-containing protein [Candidatus Solibacter usitatus]|nr:SPOR domain-containing protein [Candidatus Solibacter usitatus]